MTYSESTTPETSGDFGDDLPVKVVAELTKNPDGSPQERTLDLSTSLEAADPAAGNELSSIDTNGELVAKIESVGETFYIVRLRDQDFDTDKMGYQIFNEQNKRVSEKSPRVLQSGQDSLQPLVLVHFKDVGEDKPALVARAINDGFPIHIGRGVPKELDQKAGRFDLSGNPHISGQHLNLLRDGDDSIKLSVTSTNKTKISYAETAGSSSEDVDIVDNEPEEQVLYEERPATEAERYADSRAVESLRSVVEFLDRDHLNLADTREIDELSGVLGEAYRALVDNVQVESAQQAEVVRHLLQITQDARKAASHASLARPELKREVLTVSKELFEVRRAIRDKSTVRSLKKTSSK